MARCCDFDIFLPVRFDSSLGNLYMGSASLKIELSSVEPRPKSTQVNKWETVIEGKMSSDVCA